MTRLNLLLLLLLPLDLHCLKSSAHRSIYYVDESAVCRSKDKPCIFPFLYNGTSYSACTAVDVVWEGQRDGGFYWCANRVDGENKMLDYEKCEGECGLRGNV